MEAKNRCDPVASVCVNTIVRNGEDYIRQSLESVLPYVRRAIVTIDETSTDLTANILRAMTFSWPILEVGWGKKKNPQHDLVRMRNEQLVRVTEEYVWILDSDEVYQPHVAEQIVKILGGHDVYAFRCWAVWNETHAHRASSKAVIPRIFRMRPDRKWRGLFGKELLMLPDDSVSLCMERYIHFTHLKKDNWRTEMHKDRVADGKHLMPMPADIVEFIKLIHDKK